MKKDSILAVDIGNTNSSFGVFFRDKLLKKFDLPLESYSKPALQKKIQNWGLSGIIISSVVPKFTHRLAGDLKKITGKKPYIIGKGLKLTLKSKYRPGQLGADRLVNVIFAIRRFSVPLIIIDAGTAITLDAVSKDKTYLGGLIAPGIGISLKALNEKTALLPKVNLGLPKGIIGRDTKNAMLNGVVIGTAALLKEAVSGLKAIIGKKALILGTGGDIVLLAKLCAFKIKIEPDLTLKGLNLIYNHEIK